MLGKLEDTEIEELLAQQIIGRIGCHANGITYIVPISYTYDGEYIYGRSFDGLKIEMMRKNPQVCFQVDSMANMANWKSVIAWGTFKELTEPAERNDAIQKLFSRKIPGIPSKTMQLTGHWPFASTEQIEGIIFCIRFFKKTGRYEQTAGISN